MDLALNVRPCRFIGNVYGQPIFQALYGPLFTIHHFIYFCPVPGRIVQGQYELRQSRRLRQPDAAVAESPGSPAEQIVIGGVVQIDAVFVGKHELHGAQGIPGPRVLAKLELTRISYMVPVYGPRIEFPAVFTPTVEYPDMGAAQVVGVLSDFRHGFMARDVRGEIPERIELDVPDVVAEDRAFVVPLAHDHPHLDLHFIVDDALQIESGDIHQNIRIFQVVVHPPPSFHVHFDQPYSVLDGTFHRADCLLSHHTVGREPLHRLETLYRRFNGFIKQIRLQVIAGVFSGDNQTSSNCGHALIPVTRM